MPIKIRDLDRAVLRFVEAIISQAGRDAPVDALLRKELKYASSIEPYQKRDVAEAVFAHYRWFGWLNSDSSVMDALELDAKYRANPGAFSVDELRAKAVPAWTSAVLRVEVEWLRELQRAPTLWLRARADKQKEVENLGAKVRQRTALAYSGDIDLFRTPEFHAGDFEIQDIASQAVTWLADPRPGETWWDACAGEGGKTLHLSDMMRGKGMVVASDVAEWRLTRLKRRTARARVFNYRIAPWNSHSEKLPTKTKFDGILLDAPCSGLGTWQRNPHARWTTLHTDVDELAELQKKLLSNVSKLVKPGGKLIYAVCTLTEAETNGVANWFEEGHADFAPITFPPPFRDSKPSPRQLIWPQDSGGGGMFVAGWTRKN